MKKIKGVQMYIKQKGFLPKLCFFIGSFFSGFFIFGLIASTSVLIVSYQILSSDEITTITYRLITFPFGILLGLVIASLFPDIRVSKTGVDFVYLGLFRGSIPWSEVIHLKQLEGLVLFNGYYALFMERKKLLATLHALFIRQYNPVLLLSPELQEIRYIKEQIKEKGF